MLVADEVGEGLFAILEVLVLVDYDVLVVLGVLELFVWQMMMYSCCLNWYLVVHGVVLRVACVCGRGRTCGRRRGRRSARKG